MPGLYLHIPFCHQACTYCDFHFSTNLEGKPRLVKAICSEIELRKDYLKDKKLQSVYFGGGTPSVLSKDELKAIFNTIKKHFEVLPDAEITFELNPEDAEPKYLEELRSLGVNRLSVGLQSFNNTELKWMNRVHTAEQSIACIIHAKKAGFENISVDLIYGSRFQNEDSWRETLRKVFAMDVPHISSYNLTIEGKTKLQHLLQRNEEPEIDSELSARSFDILMEETEKHGYEHYEISNFCKPGFMAVHNSNYWRGAHYFGVGPSAHSYNGTSRSFNVKSNAGYMQSVEKGKQFWEEEILSATDKYNEYVLTRLRTSWGCDTSEMKELFGEQYVKHYQEGLKKHAGHILISGNIVTLTKSGKHFADGIAADLFM